MLNYGLSEERKFFIKDLELSLVQLAKILVSVKVRNVP